MTTQAQRDAMKRWRERHPTYHREWMRRWRSNEENRTDEMLKAKLRRYAIADEKAKSQKTDAATASPSHAPERARL
jgi:hypothetical protein